MAMGARSRLVKVTDSSCVSKVTIVDEASTQPPRIPSRATANPWLRRRNVRCAICPLPCVMRARRAPRDDGAAEMTRPGAERLLVEPPSQNFIDHLWVRLAARELHRLADEVAEQVRLAA